METPVILNGPTLTQMLQTTHTSKGLPWPQRRQRSTVKQAPLFTLRDNNMSVLSVFSLLHSFSSICSQCPPPPSPYLISRMTICDLYTMPRVAEPVWLTMMSGASEKNQLCGYFMRELSLLMEQASKNQLSVLLYSQPLSHLQVNMQPFM